MHTRLANLNVPAVQRVDDRTIEVIATGLPLRHGSHAIDTMLVSPLTGAAQPRRRSGQYAGATLHTSRQNKERTYPELAGSNRCRLVVLAMEVGGRWSPEAAIFPPAARPNESPGNPRTFAAHLGGFTHRTMVSYFTHAAMQAFAASLLNQSADSALSGDGVLSPPGRLVTQAPSTPTAPSRIPGR